MSADPKTFVDPDALGRVIAYDAGFARIVDSITAAILYRHLRWTVTSSRSKSARDPEGWFAYPLAELTDHLAFGDGEMRGARLVLEALGLVQTKRTGMPPKLYWRLDRERFAGLVNGTDQTNSQLPEVTNSLVVSDDSAALGPAKKTGPSSSETLKDLKTRDGLPAATGPVAMGHDRPPVQPVTKASLLAGTFDGHPLAITGTGPKVAQALAICDAVVGLWAATWGKQRVTLTTERKKVWARWVGEKKTASEIAMAVVGMAYDDSPADRSLHNDWHLVARNFDVWVGLYQRLAAKGARPVWPKTSASSVPGCRQWRGIWIPDNHTPDKLDEDRIAEGTQVFIIDDRTWADPSWDPSGRIAAQAQKYGANINRPVNARTP